MAASKRPRFDLLVLADRVATCDGPRSPAERLGVIEGGAIGIRDGRVEHVGARDEVPRTDALRVLDRAGCVVLPGLVDPHTHLVFGGSRIDEFARKMAGEDYRTIAAEGGGIAATVRATRAASDDELFDSARRRALAMRRHGVTSAEIKSGYGLTLRDELRCLAVGRRLAREGILHTTTTFLGAHAVPPEHKGDRARYLDLVVSEMLPAVSEGSLADSCDVYIDEGAFTLAEGRRVLEAASAHGLRVRAHVGQFKDVGGAELVAELQGLSADHLEAVSDAALAALASAGVVAVLLPGAWRTLRQTPPDAARLRAAGVPLAIGTDCNPGTSPCTDLPLCAALAVRDAGVTLEEAVLGVTSVAARAAGIADAGRIAPGCRADLAVFAGHDVRALAYGLGDVTAQTVVLGGQIVYDAEPQSLLHW